MRRLLWLIVFCVGSVNGAELTSKEIRWELENPFRLFNDPGVFAELKALHRSGMSPETLLERYIQQKRTAGALDRGVFPYENTAWDQRSARYSPEYLRPRQHRIRVGLAEGSAPSGSCTWTLVSRLGVRSSTSDCAQKASFEIPYPEGGALTVDSGSVKTAPVRIAVEDKLILTLGDSYAAGEGTPDRPFRYDLQAAEAEAAKYDEKTALYWFTSYPIEARTDSRKGENPTRWWDRECHRSLWSWPFLTSLIVALEDRAGQTAYTFVSYACSGAEVVDGFLAAQSSPPFPRDSPPLRSQLAAAIEDLCLDAEHYDAQDMFYSLMSDGSFKVGRCAAGSLRPIDMLLLSLGGNDAGFGPVIAFEAMPYRARGRILKPIRQIGLNITRFAAGVKSPRLAKKAVDGELVWRYWDVRLALQDRLHVAPEKVFFMKYPDVLYKAAGEPRQYCDPESKAGFQPLALYIADVAPPPRFPQIVRKNIRRWDTWLSEGESKDATLNLVEPLQRTQVGAAKTHGWNLFYTHVAEFEKHGICATPRATDPQDQFDLPQRMDARWQPVAPDIWDPYHKRTRWLNTFSDAFMMMRSESAMEGMRGVFHPNIWGYAAIAQGAVERVKGNAASR